MSGAFPQADITLPEITVTPNPSPPANGSPYGLDTSLSPTGTAASVGHDNVFGIPSTVVGAANSFDSGIGAFPSPVNSAGDSSGTSASSGGSTTGFASILTVVANYLERGGLLLLAIVVIAVGGWALVRRG